MLPRCAGLPGNSGRACAHGAGGIDELKVLLRYQASAIALSAEHQLLVIEKSRRTGISYAFAADAVLTAAPPSGRRTSITLPTTST
jgi:hypothetical protein